MDPNFFYYPIYHYDRFIQRQPCACVCKLFFEKLLLRNCLPDFYQIAKECSLDRGYKLLFTLAEKSGLWSDTGAQAPLVVHLHHFFYFRSLSKVLHHIQTDPDGVNFPAVEETIFEAKRVLKKDGVIAIGTCFPDTYISLIWYTKLSDAISDRFRKRFPSFDQLSSIFDRNGLKLLSKLDVYEPPIPKIVAAMTDPLGPTKKAWRDINSYWALGTPEEIADIENKVLKMHDEGTLELFVKENTKMDYLYRPTLLFLTPL